MIYPSDLMAPRSVYRRGGYQPNQRTVCSLYQDAFSFTCCCGREPRGRCIMTMQTSNELRRYGPPAERTKNGQTADSCWWDDAFRRPIPASESVISPNVRLLLPACGRLGIDDHLEGTLFHRSLPVDDKQHPCMPCIQHLSFLVLSPAA